jgi:hypothetical protein
MIVEKQEHLHHTNRMRIIILPGLRRALTALAYLHQNQDLGQTKQNHDNTRILGFPAPDLALSARGGIIRITHDCSDKSNE